jgi:hypothetical protein
LLGPDAMKKFKIPLVYVYDTIKVTINDDTNIPIGTAKFGQRFLDAADDGRNY